MVLACLVLLSAAAWFLFTARAVEIASDPPADRVTVDGARLKIELGGRYLLRPGQYQVRLEKDGYLPFAISLEVTREANQSYRYTLEKMPGLLVITAHPGADAEVRVDGKSVGRTPIEPVPLAEGDHLVEVIHSRYVPFSTTISMEGAGSTFDLAVDLTPNWAVVEFKSKPTGATIRIDGQSQTVS
jgi:hypothetical protein